jgi:alanine racemase
VTGYRPTSVTVDLAAIRSNVTALTPPDAGLMAIVKADGYGHGAAAVALAALEAGAASLGVALVEEGLALRAAGVDASVLVLSEFPPGSEAVALAHRLTPTVYTDDGLARVSAAARGPVDVHVKVDTGMHRAGVWPPEAAVAFVARAVSAGHSIEALWTHFARSEEDEATTKGQLERFLGVVDAVRATGVSPRYLHAANTGAVLRHPEAHLDVVRPGIGIYGVAPAPGLAEDTGLRPALTWRSTVSAVRRLGAGERVSYGHRYELDRDGWVATVPVGYADGYPRSASSRADVLIRGQRCRVAGSVTMDHLVVDCGDLAVRTGEEVVLLGKQAAEEVTAWELAAHADTIAYEVLARIGERVPREHVG